MLFGPSLFQKNQSVVTPAFPSTVYFPLFKSFLLECLLPSPVSPDLLPLPQGDLSYPSNLPIPVEVCLPRPELPWRQFSAPSLLSLLIVCLSLNLTLKTVAKGSYVTAQEKGAVALTTMLPHPTTTTTLRPFSGPVLESAGLGFPRKGPAALGTVCCPAECLGTASCPDLPALAVLVCDLDLDVLIPVCRIVSPCKLDSSLSGPPCQSWLVPLSGFGPQIN